MLGKIRNIRVKMFMELAVKKIKGNHISEEALQALAEIADKGSVNNECRENAAIVLMENKRNLSDSAYKAIQFRKLVNLMNGDQANRDREVGFGYAATLLPQEIKDALAALADDIPMLENLRAELEASNRVHNWNHSWRYHHSKLKEIDRLEGKGP